MALVEFVSAWGNWLLSAGVLIIVGLGGYAWFLWQQVWARRKAVAEQQIQHQRSREEDLRVLAKALLEERLPLIEGGLRIKVLLDNYDSPLRLDPNCKIFQVLYQATAHIPTHDAWKALDKSERRRHEATFSALEHQHKTEARQAAHWLLSEGLPQPNR